MSHQTTTVSHDALSETPQQVLLSLLPPSHRDPLFPPERVSKENGLARKVSKENGLARKELMDPMTRVFSFLPNPQRVAKTCAHLHECYKQFQEVSSSSWSSAGGGGGVGPGGPPSIVLDCGSQWLRAGFSGEAGPRSVFQNVNGTPKREEQFLTMSNRTRGYVGDQAFDKWGQLRRVFPVSPSGIITDWKAMENIWFHTFFNELRVDPTASSSSVKSTEGEEELDPQWDSYPSEGTDLFLCDGSVKLPNLQNRKQLAETVFEKLEIPTLRLHNTNALDLFSTGRTTGLAVNIGAGGTKLVPVYEGAPVRRSSYHWEVPNGKELTGAMSRYLSEEGYSLTTTAELEIVRTMKETLCFVAESKEKHDELRGEQYQPEQCAFDLPDGSTITVGASLFRTPEVLFQPYLIGYSSKDNYGLHAQVIHALKSAQASSGCWDELIDDFAQNVVLSGGGSGFRGLRERLLHELSKSSSSSSSLKLSTRRQSGNRNTNSTPAQQQPSPTFKVLQNPSQSQSSWIGGSVLCSLSNRDAISFTVTKEDFAGVGENIFRTML